MIITIRSDDGSRIEMLLEKPASHKAHEDWVEANINFTIGKFSGSINASLQFMDLEKLHNDLLVVHGSLTGKVILTPLEGQIELIFDMKPRGRMDISGLLKEYPGYGATLSFCMEADQSYLPELLDQLSKYISSAQQGDAPEPATNADSA